MDKMPKKPAVDLRPYMHDTPQLADNQEWHIVGYLVEKTARQCLRKFSDFETMQFIGQSGNYWHFIGDGRTVLVCSIKFKKQ